MKITEPVILLVAPRGGLHVTAIGAGEPEIPAQASDTLRGKRSILLDLASPPGRAQLEDLLAEADLLVQGCRPGAPGGGFAVRVVRPPGQIGELAPTWTHETDLATDAPSFAA